MPVVINGSSGLTANDGSVFTDSSGNVGIGTSSPGAKLDVVTGSTNRLRVSESGSSLFFDSLNAAASAWSSKIERATQYQWLSGASGTPATGVILDSSGNLLVGTTSSSTPVSGFTAEVSAGGSGIYTRINIGHSSSAGVNESFARFLFNSTVIGTITRNGASTVAYNTSSDYRLKENVQPMTGALTTVSALKPVTYTWKADGSEGQGFIAHELAEVVPDCVSGEKDAVDAEGNPQYQGIDTSFLVATLTAAIQELKAIVDAQGAEIAALKGQA